MRTRWKRDLAWVAACIAAMAWIAFRLDFHPFGEAPRVRGVVRHVLSTDAGEEAIVELDDGDSVTAAVPATFKVVPGQRAELRSEGWGPAQRYTVRSSWDIDI